MIKITRDDIFARDESGGAWFEEFLQSLAEQKESSTEDIINAIQHKKSETVKGVVDKYREMVGLDSAADVNDKSIVSQAAYENVKPLSTRHAKILEANVVSEIEQNTQAKDAVRSFCENSGGTKGTHSIISFLRGMLGKELIQYSDKDLIEYIENTKKEYKEDVEAPCVDVGRVGIDTEDNPDDNAADYITHGKGS